MLKLPPDEKKSGEVEKTEKEGTAKRGFVHLCPEFTMQKGGVLPGGKGDSRGNPKVASGGSSQAAERTVKGPLIEGRDDSNFDLLRRPTYQGRRGKNQEREGSRARKSRG